ncbi:MAG: SpoIIIAH-like family protein [Dethiobacter sp.]|jgi:stage III sporulation protein AH|nr:MAG: SpoIIIAH-like family protein [Dethiobacter sp.]
MNRKTVWFLSIFLVAVVTYFFVGGLEKEMSRIEIAPDEEIFRPILSGDLSDDPAKWQFDDAHAFFVEYRLERDRVRGQEVEMLNEMINNPQVGAEARNEAEKQLLNLVDLMEKELIIENMLKAQGYNDALLFARKGVATVMIHAEQLSEGDFIRITEMVSAISGVSREQVQIIQHK